MVWSDQSNGQLHSWHLSLLSPRTRLAVRAESTLTEHSNWLSGRRSASVIAHTSGGGDYETLSKPKNHLSSQFHSIWSSAKYVNKYYFNLLWYIIKLIQLDLQHCPGCPSAGEILGGIGETLWSRWRSPNRRTPSRIDGVCSCCCGWHFHSNPAKSLNGWLWDLSSPRPHGPNYHYLVCSRLNADPAPWWMVEENYWAKDEP